MNACLVPKTTHSHAICGERIELRHDECRIFDADGFAGHAARNSETVFTRALFLV